MRFECVDYQKGVGLHGSSFEDKNALGSSLLALLQMFLGDALHPNFYTVIVFFALLPHASMLFSSETITTYAEIKP